MTEESGLRPLCFVLMPFGTKQDAGGGTIDFDAIYAQIIGPAIEKARMEPVRADEEHVGGVIQKPMFERLILCEFAVADLTTANANVFYELGIRHAIRPQSTVLVFSATSRLPFDVQDLRALPYALDGGLPSDAAADAARLADLLEQARGGVTDSPVYQLVGDLAPADISRLKTDVFRDRVEYAADKKHELAAAREEGVGAVRAVHEGLDDIANTESGVVIDLFLSYRTVRAWDEMIALTDEMAEPLARSVLVREQKALALNRSGRGGEAERILLELIDELEPSSETLGILGRVYKDRWQEAREAGETALAGGHLRRAIDAYVRGFEADWRDAYPGVNAVTLMELADPPDPRQAELLPVVRYSAQRRLATGRADYWDHATLLELAVLASDREAAERHLSDAVAVVREAWEPETTLRNLRLIGTARAERGERPDWFDEIEQPLERLAEGS